MLSGDNSILSRATQAKERTEFAKVKEEIALAQAEAVGNHYLGGSSDTIEAQVLAKLTAAGYTIGSENSGNIQNISLSSNSVTIEEGGNTAEVTATLNTSEGGTNYVLINGLYYPLNKKANGDIELGETGKKTLENSTVSLSDVTLAETGSINATLDSSTGKVTITSTNVTADENGDKVELKYNNTTYGTINVAVKKASITISPETVQIGFTETKTLSVTLADYQKGTVTWTVTSGGSYISIPGSTTGASVEVKAGSTATPSGSPAIVTAKYTTGTESTTTTCQVTVANIREGTLDEQDLTWADLSSLAKQISASSSINDYDAGPITIGGKTLKIGDTKSLQIGSDIYLAEIIGFKHDNLATSAQTGGYSEKTKAGITFQLKELISSTHYMNSSDTSEGGWKDTAMRAYLNTETNNVFSQINDGAENVIVTVKKDYMASYNATAVATTPSEDKLWLLSCSEIWPQNTGGTRYAYAKLQEGEQYQYYITATNGVAYYDNSGNPKLVKNILNGSSNSWWLRSPIYGGGNDFCYLNSMGRANDYYFDNSYGVAFGFSI